MSSRFIRSCALTRSIPLVCRSLTADLRGGRRRTGSRCSRRVTKPVDGAPQARHLNESKPPEESRLLGLVVGGDRHSVAAYPQRRLIGERSGNVNSTRVMLTPEKCLLGRGGPPDLQLVQFEVSSNRYGLFFS